MKVSSATKDGKMVPTVPLGLELGRADKSAQKTTCYGAIEQISQQ